MTWTTDDEYAGPPPSVSVRALADALVLRWTARGSARDLDPWLSLWDYAGSTARLRGEWSASARVAQQLDAWSRVDLVRHLAAADDGTVAPVGATVDGPSGSILAWARTGRPKVTEGDRAWYAALTASRPAESRMPTLLVVTRSGWVTVPGGVVRHRRPPRRS